MALGYDGSIRINTKINTGDFAKGLEKMSADMAKQVKKSETLLAQLQEKRKALADTSLLKGAELDAEKAKLASLKKDLQEMREIAKDTTFSRSTREEAKANIPGAQNAVKEQQERVRALQAEWNKTQSEVERYDAKIAEATRKLEQQKIESQEANEALSQKRQELEKINQTAEIGNQRIIDLSRQLSELQSRQKELSNAGLGLGYKEFDENERAIASITEELKKYQAELKNTSEKQAELQGILGALKQAGSGAGDLFGGGIKDVTDSVSAFAGKQQDLQNFLGTLQQIGGYLGGSFGSSLSEAAGSLSSFAGELGPVIIAVKAAFDAIKTTVTAIVSRFKEIVSNISGVVVPVAKKIGEVMSKAFSGIQKGASALGKGLAEATKGIVEFAKENNVLTKVTDAVGTKLERLGGMIRRVFIFSVITKGLRELRSELVSYLAVNEQFSSALRTLQGVLLTAFQPIYDAVLPAVITLINIVSHAIAVVSQFIATLFGTTAKKAQQNAKSLYQQAHAVEAVGSAAKEAAKEAETAVAAFDEFNILAFPDQSSGGGGGGGGGIEMPDFDYEYDDMPFDSWGEAFSAFLDKLLAGLPKLEEAFKKFADWLNDLAKKLYDMFTFPGVLDKVKQLGKGLAEALNKLVNWIDWNMLGKALGAGLNLALNFLTSFLYAFDWMNLGRKLAEFVNGLASEIDWYEFGRLLWAGFKIALETLAGFILGLDMPLMAKAASSIVKGFFDEMYNTIQRIPWYEIGKQIATFLNNIDWYGSITVALKAISAAIEALFEMLDGFVRNMQWGDIAKQIYTAINDSLGLIDWHNIGQTLGNAFVQAFEFARKIIAGIDWHMIGSNIADFILGFDFVSALSSLGQLIAAGINAAARAACGFLDQIEPELRSIAEGIAEGLRKTVTAIDWKALGDAIGRGIKGALTFVAGLLDPDLFYEIGRAIGDFLVNLDWVGIIGGLAEVLARAIGAAVAAVQGFLDSVKPHLKEIAEGIADKINQFLRDVDWKEVGRTISDGLETALDFLITLIENIDWTDVGNAVGDLLSGIDWDGIFERVCRIIADVFGAKLLAKIIALPDLLKAGIAIVEGLIKGIWEGIKGIGTIIYNSLFKPIVDAITDSWEIHSPSKVTERIGKNIVEGLIKGIKDTWNGVLEFFQEKVEAIKEYFQGAWDGIKEHTSQAWESIKTTLGDAWNSIKETATTTFDSIKEKITAAWDGVKEKTSAVWADVKTALSDAWESLKEKAATAFDGIKEKIATIWENVKEKTTSTWESIKTSLTTAWENLKTSAATAFENIKEKISTAWENVKSKTTEIWNNIKTTLENTWNSLKETARSKFEEIKTKIVEVWTTIKSEAVSKWEEIKSTITGKVEEIKSKVTEGFAKVKETMISKVSEAVDGLKSKDWASVGRSIVDGISNGLNGIFDKLRGWATQVWNTISSAFDSGARSSGGSSGRRSSRAASYSTASLPSGYEAYSVSDVPKLANGSVIPPNQQFMAILGDQRSGVNIEAPLKTIETALQNVVDRNGGLGGSSGPLEINLMVDRKVLARVIVPEINDMTRAAGKPVLLF